MLLTSKDRNKRGTETQIGVEKIWSIRKDQVGRIRQTGREGERKRDRDRDRNRER